MRGDNHLLALTTAVDEVTGEIKPLFSFPIQVCKATGEMNDVTFDIAGPSGAPRAQVYRDTGTGELIEPDECKRGVRIGDVFHEIDEEVIEEINAQTKISTMVALGSVDFDDITPTLMERVTGYYYLQSPPKGGSAKAYRLTYEALLEKRKGKQVIRKAKAIVTKRTPKSRQKLCLIYASPTRECLCMFELAFGANVRDPDSQVLSHQYAEVTDEQVDMARQVIDQMEEGTIPLENEIDDAIPLREALMQKAAEGIAIKPAAKLSASVATEDLTALLAASIK